ncbi:MAG: CubicO group peptidase (beta-lactamase class C family), partial [Halieaceae bacterium]
MPDFARHLDDYVPEQLKQLNLPGTAIALIENGQPVSYKCYGLADVASGRPIDTDTLFQIASISKSVAAWGVMLLVDRGLLDLDRPINDYLTRWKIPGGEYDANAVTPRLLLMHFGGTSMSGCAGVPYGHSEYSIENILNGHIPGLDAEQLKYAKRWGVDPEAYGNPVILINEPGSTCEYSGGGLTILELLVEELSG